MGKIITVNREKLLKAGFIKPTKGDIINGYKRESLERNSSAEFKKFRCYFCPKDGNGYVEFDHWPRDFANRCYTIDFEHSDRDFLVVHGSSRQFNFNNAYEKIDNRSHRNGGMWTKQFGLTEISKHIGRDLGQIRKGYTPAYHFVNDDQSIEIVVPLPKENRPKK